VDCMQIVEDSSRWSTPKTASKGGPFSFVFKSLRWIQTARTSHIHIALEPFRFRLRRTSVLRHSVDSNDDSVSYMVNLLTTYVLGYRPDGVLVECKNMRAYVISCLGPRVVG